MGAQQIITWGSFRPVLLKLFHMPVVHRRARPLNTLHTSRIWADKPPILQEKRHPPHVRFLSPFTVAYVCCVQ